MACPFLREGKARYCHAAPLRKLILDGPGAAGGGKCDSAEFQKCELAAKDTERRARCPHLEEIRVQYCGVSAVTKLVPFSDSELSSCTSNSYRYCDSYLSLARPHASVPDGTLFYSANHFWLEAEESGLCHIGMDGFFAEVVGGVDGVTFATLHGTHCPALALNIQGVEWPLNFPNPLIIEKVNSRVRSDPARLTSDPYGAGWLFEGHEIPGVTRAGLVSGRQAVAWDGEERERLTREIHEAHVPGGDGGAPVRGVAKLLSRPDLVCLFQRFFSRSEWAVEG